MIKLSKTEQRILRVASHNNMGLIRTVRREGTTTRNLQAVRSLRKKGLLISGGEYTEWDMRRGRTTLYEITNDAITDAGRETVKNLKTVS